MMEWRKRFKLSEIDEDGIPTSHIGIEHVRATFALGDIDIVYVRLIHRQGIREDLPREK